MIRVSHRGKIEYFSMKISAPKDNWNEKENFIDVKIKNFSQVNQRKNFEIRKSQLKLMGIVNDLDFSNHCLQLMI